MPEETIEKGIADGTFVDYRWKGNQLTCTVMSSIKQVTDKVLCHSNLLLLTIVKFPCIMLFSYLLLVIVTNEISVVISLRKPIQINSPDMLGCHVRVLKLSI